MNQILFSLRLPVLWLLCGLALARSVPAQTPKFPTLSAPKLTAPKLSAQAAVSALPLPAPPKPPVTTADEPPPVTNASAAELQSIRAAVAGQALALTHRDPAALELFGLQDVPASIELLAPRTRLMQVAVGPAGALVRQAYRITGRTADGSLAEFGQGTHELWLKRDAAGFAWASRHWGETADAVAVLADAARREWAGLSFPVVSGATALPAPATRASASGARALPVLLHLVAERRGGRWIALRSSRWDGSLFDDDRLAQLQTQNENKGAADVPAWLRQQMASLPAEQAGEVHFILQNGLNGWVGLGAEWETLPGPVNGAETVAANHRLRMESVDYLSAPAHRDFGLALQKVGLYAEADDELQKAELLQTGLISASVLRQARELRTRDPIQESFARMEREAQIGLDGEHPAYLIEKLTAEYRANPNPLWALRIGTEYSRLAEENQAALWLAAAEDLSRRGALISLSQYDRAWINILRDHLLERRRQAAWKPPRVLRSALFTVRCFPNEKSVLKLLAALDSAQHTVYAGFGIPMGNTEVVLWRAQGEFQRYTVQFSPQASSELVAGMTLTKLMTTSQGPLILGEEINAFVVPRSDFFGTIAHEYGHVAVRHLSHGRMVPVWFNEGIAAAVEGGYEGYLPRVREATARNILLTMPELMSWNVDGTRAFLAYSQANSMIDYIVARWGREAVLNILRQIGQDVPTDTAFRNALGVTQQGLWNLWAREGIR